MKCLCEFLWFWWTTTLPHHGMLFYFDVAIKNPGLITIHNMIQKFLPFIVTHTTEGKLGWCPALLFRFVHMHFGHPICRLYGSAASLPQFHRVMYMKFVEKTLITLKLWTDNFHQFCCCLITKVIIHSGWAATAIFTVHICLTIFELPKPLLHFPLIHNTWHINATVLPMNFNCSKILLHSKTTSLQGFQNWWDFWLSCST